MNKTLNYNNFVLFSFLQHLEIIHQLFSKVLETFMELFRVTSTERPDVYWVVSLNVMYIICNVQNMDQPRG